MRSYLAQRLFLYHTLACLLLFSAFSHAQASEQEQQIGLLWKIDKFGYAPSYLLGTIHSEDPRILNLPPKIEKYYKKSKSVTIEVAITLPTLFKSILAMYLPIGKTLDTMIEPDKYQQLVEALKEYGIPEIAVKTIKPSALMMVLSMPKSKEGQFLDMMLYFNAQAQGKPVYGLETAEEQLAIFDTLNLDEQIILLEETLNQIKQMPDLLETMHQLYLKRNLTEIMNFSYNYMSSEKHQKVVDKFMAYIVDQRNLTMLERMKPRLREGHAFIAVGALHLPGERGLLKLLEQEGFRVKSIY
ncbi:TraB/GumN family protein [Candidatus Albibeggiatoa sp. nov. NOAA]|uniref:TraB/GumN family protein n=1 Tax=Candidatus Albibeggiatoa sp. nov. NOAA TaxID=3162724 RepID=UPI0032FA033D|nr:TraB/GumN family protein [Thiotrichaceae bacterium]